MGQHLALQRLCHDVLWSQRCAARPRLEAFLGRGRWRAVKASSTTAALLGRGRPWRAVKASSTSAALLGRGRWRAVKASSTTWTQASGRAGGSGRARVAAAARNRGVRVDVLACHGG